MAESPQWRRSVLIRLFPVAAITAVCRPVRHFEFINFDEDR
jgi:hypothetical protein